MTLEGLSEVDGYIIWTGIMVVILVVILWLEGWL